MNSTYELRTDTHQEISRLLSSINPTSQQRWRMYLGIAPDQIQLSQDHQQRIQLTKMFHQLHQRNHGLFHMTVTYKTYKNTPHTPKNTDDFFINFYLKCFLPELLGTRNIQKKRNLQPICYSFLDEHEFRPRVFGTKVTFLDRLHHHAILAVHPNTIPRMNTMIGENCIPFRNKWASKVMTTHMRQCEPMTTLYATKQLKKYPEFLSFPDRLH
jgi:hypothetical protein